MKPRTSAVLSFFFLLSALLPDAPAQPNRPPVLRAPRQTKLVSETPVLVTNMPGELEVAVSPDGNHVLIGLNFPRNATFGFSAQTLWFSNDGGLNFQPSNPAAGQANRRDPTVAWAGSGAFYFAATGTNRTLLVSQSVDGGANFAARTAAGCGALNPCFSDQPHLAADPRTCFRATTGECQPGDPVRSAGQDELYMIWRQLSAPETPIIECSPDGGATWQSQQAAGVGLLPRVAVGPDGSVFAIGSSSRTGDGRVRVQKFSSCRAGLTPQFAAPVVVTTIQNVGCPVPGLDRCNNGNILSSPMVAVDRGNPSQVYVAVASQTSASGEEIQVFASGDGGMTFSPSVTAHTSEAAGRRFLPWACGGNDSVYVGWYDRGGAPANQNDATEYKINRLRISASGLTKLEEISLSGVADLQCGNNWPLPARNANDSESCSVQPQNGGLCFLPASPSVVCDATTPCAAGLVCRNAVCGTDTTACDFSDGCSGAATCMVGRGIAKYGDYNGIACSDGAAFAVWASTVAPPGLAPVTGLNVFFARIRARTTPFLDACRSNPLRCAELPTHLPGKIRLKCSQPGCRLVDPIPEICQRVVDCPGCGRGQLCGPDRIVLKGLGDAWRVDVVDQNGRPAKARVRRSKNQTVIDFSAVKRLTGDYFLVYRMTGKGRQGVEYELTASIPAR